MSLADIPCDIDPSIFEQFAPKREGVQTTYNGKLCYTPVFAVVGRERFCINHWLLPGREKAVERIDEFIRETAELLPEKIARNKLLFRYDAGLYSIKTVQASEDAGAYYLVKARTSGATGRSALRYPSNKTPLVFISSTGINGSGVLDADTARSLLSCRYVKYSVNILKLQKCTSIDDRKGRITRCEN